MYLCYTCTSNPTKDCIFTFIKANSFILAQRNEFRDFGRGFSPLYFYVFGSVTWSPGVNIIFESIHVYYMNNKTPPLILDQRFYNFGRSFHAYAHNDYVQHVWLMPRNKEQFRKVAFSPKVLALLLPPLPQPPLEIWIIKLRIHTFTSFMLHEYCSKPNGRLKSKCLNVNARHTQDDKNPSGSGGLIYKHSTLFYGLKGLTMCRQYVVLRPIQKCFTHIRVVKSL